MRSRILLLGSALVLLLQGTSLADSGAFLGVMLQGLDEMTLQELGYDGRGVYVPSVVEDGPAEKAGMRDKDIIVELGDDGVVGPGHLKELLAYYSPGDGIKVKVWRDGKTKTFEVELGERKTKAKKFPKTVIIKGAPSAWMGVVVQDLSEQLGEYFGADKGVLVTEVVEDGPAEKAGIEAGDVIAEVDGEDVQDPFDLTHNILADKEPGTVVSLVLVRDGKEIVKDLELVESPEKALKKQSQMFMWNSDDDETEIEIMKKIPGLPFLPSFQSIDIDEREELSEEMEKLSAEMEELKKGMEELRKSLKSE